MSHWNQNVNIMHPLPGDLVRIINSTDSLIKPNSIGVIEGQKGSISRSVHVCWNSQVPWGGGDNENSISCSGGPSWDVDVRRLRPTNEKIEYPFHDGEPRESTIVKRTCRVWYFDPKSVGPQNWVLYCYQPCVLRDGRYTSIQPYTDEKGMPYYPFFDTADEAARYMIQNELTGEVQRYVKPNNPNARPYVTAGVSAVVKSGYATYRNDYP